MREIEVVAEFFSALAFFLILPSIFFFAQMMSSGSRGAGAKDSRISLMLACWVAACIFPVLNIMEGGGSSTAAEWIAEDWALQDEEWKTLEIAWVLSESRRLWLSTLDWLFLAGGLAFTSAVARNQSRAVYSNRFCAAGFVLSAFAVITFMLECLRFSDWGTWSIISGISALATVVVGLPLWLFWFGRQIDVGAATMHAQFVGESDTDNMELQQA